MFALHLVTITMNEITQLCKNNEESYMGNRSQLVLGFLS